MSTHSTTPRPIEHSVVSVLVIVLMAMTLAFATGCSFSLTNKSPEILRYCKVADRPEAAGPDDSAAQRAPRTEGTANDLPSDCDDTNCGGDTSGEEASARRTVCAP
jgi:hypothetical protein